MSISHDIDAEHAVAVRYSLKRNAMFSDFTRRWEFPYRETIELVEISRHRAAP
jgi:hypothetical protein